MNWGKWSDTSNVLTFVITAITAAIGLFNWLSVEVNPTIGPITHTPFLKVAGHPLLPIFLIGLLIVSFCFSGIAHFMARRQVSQQSPAHTVSQNREMAAGELLNFLDAIKMNNPSEEPAIKLVASDVAYDLAQLLTRSLILMGYKMIDNPDNASYVFPARKVEEGITLRTRPRGDISDGKSWKLSTLAFAFATGFKRLKLPYYSADFPENPRYDYLQIELFGSL